MASKSPAYRLFTHPFVQVQIKENFKALRHWPLWGKFHVSILWRHHGSSLVSCMPAILVTCMMFSLPKTRNKSFWCQSASKIYYERSPTYSKTLTHWLADRFPTIEQAIAELPGAGDMDLQQQTTYMSLTTARSCYPLMQMGRIHFTELPSSCGK